MANLKAGRSDEKKCDTPTVTATSSPPRYIMLQSTTDSSGYIPSSYHYRTPTQIESNTDSQYTPPYMAPTISSAMKMKQRRYISSEPSLCTPRRQNSVSTGLRTAASFTLSRNRRSHQSTLRLWQRTTSQPLPKMCRKERFVNSSERVLHTAEYITANESNQQNLQRISPQPSSGVARRSSHRGGLYRNYLKELFWDRISSRCDGVSRKEDQAVNSAMDVQNAQTETSLYLEQLSKRNSYQEETSPLHLGRGHLQQEDQVHNDIPTPSLCTAQVKTPRGWQRTFSRVPCKISRLDRFAPQFVEAVSAQVWITESPQQIVPLAQSPHYASSKIDKYNIWQWVSSNSPQRISRFKRFWRSQIKNTKSVSEPSQCISQLEKSADQFASMEPGISRGVVWKRTISKSLPKVSRLHRFPVPENSASKISQNSPRSGRYEQQVSEDSLATQTSLSNAPKLFATLSIPLQQSLFCEQSKLTPLQKVSSKNNHSSLHTSHLRSLEVSSTESLFSGELSEKRSNFKNTPLCKASNSECSQKNAPSISRTIEIQSSEELMLPDVVSYGGSLWKRSKSILQRTSRFGRFQRRTSSASNIASTKSCEAPTISNVLFSKVPMRKRSKMSKLFRRTSRFDRFPKNTLSNLSTARVKSSFTPILPETSSSKESLSERSKSTPSRKFCRQSYFLPSRYLASSSCIWNRLTVESMQKNSRTERFQNSASVDLRTAKTRPSSPSLFSNISLIPSRGGSLWMQMKAIQSKNISRFCHYHSDFQEVTMNISNPWKKEDMNMLGRSSRFKRFQDNFSPNTHTAQSILSQNLSAKRFLKKRTKRKVPHRISREERFKTDHIPSELTSSANYCHYDNNSLCSDSPAHSLLTAQQRSPEQSLISDPPTNTDSSEDTFLTDSSEQAMDSNRNQQLEQQISYKEQFENRTPASLNILNETKEGRNSESRDSAAIQQTQPISYLDRTEGQYFDSEWISLISNFDCKWELFKTMLL